MSQRVSRGTRFRRNVAMVRTRIGLTLLAAMDFLKRRTPGIAWLLAPLALLILVVPALAAVGNNSTVAGNGAGGFSGDGGLATWARRQSRRSLHTAPTVTRSGDVAVIEDDGTLMIRLTVSISPGAASTSSAARTASGPPLRAPCRSRRVSVRSSTWGLVQASSWSSRCASSSPSLAPTTTVCTSTRTAT